jgi:GT2 family glycosyltransferase
MDNKAKTWPAVTAVVITRNRVDLLRRTIASLKQSKYPILEIIVSDDSTDNSTAKMLKAEFPEVLWIKGPQRGRSANRNNGMKAARADYVLVSDDDVIVDPEFVRLTIRQAAHSSGGMFFTATSEYGRTILPNALGFLGFSTKLYAPGDPYVTANSHCFILSKSVTDSMAYDENIEAYGYEEVDFAYRIVASGFSIHCIAECKNIHLDPVLAEKSRPEKNASRLYVTFKRYAYVDRRPLAAMGFLCLAIPHHLFGSIRRRGLRGLTQAVSNFRLAAKMLQSLRRSVASESQSATEKRV